ncbi:hypothetical protein F4780DRAFT_718549 [Xylariomycetidae sp. FL0641]|nr:hypothetical protein F4780DRAFT_718549 [Xylariomycetidae sp. FL0641]
MGNISSNLSVALIAAIVEGQASGLPEIGAVRRQEQRTERIGDVTFLQGFPSAASRIKSSEWASRGWTFQESYLARRRLIFTDYGVSFLCNSMHRTENVKQPFRQVHYRAPDPGSPDYNELRDSGFHGLIPLKTSSWLGDWTFWPLEEYSRRTLRHDSDALNACLGILQRLGSLGLKSIWGLSLGLRSFHWFHPKPARRRNEFPSWSYIGWDGTMSVPRRSLDFKIFSDILLGGRDGTDIHQPLICVCDYKASPEEQGESYKFLHISSNVISTALVRISSSESLGYRLGKMNKSTQAHGNRGAFNHAWSTAGDRYLPHGHYACFDEKDLSSLEVLIVPLYGERVKILGQRWVFSRMYMLVLQPQNGVFRRVGCIGIL